MNNLNTNIMKRIKILALIISFLAIGIACKDSFLKVNPTASLTEAGLKTKDGIEGSLISVYSMLQGRAGFYSGVTNWFWGGVLGGDANKGSNAGDQAQVNEIMTYSAQASNVSILDKYQACYEGIARANAVLAALPDGPTDTGEPLYKKRIEGETRFLRAFYYFELKKLFNNTPYIDESIDEKKINTIGNSTDLWANIEADFKFAYENLATKQNAAGRANKWAAGAYLAKAYLYQKKYKEAKEIFDVVISTGVNNSGDKYGLLPKYGDLFRYANDNNVEIVFSIQSVAGTGSTNNANPDLVLNFTYTGGPAGCCGFDQPSFDLVNSFRTVNGLPLFDGQFNLPANQVKSDQGLSQTVAFAPDAGDLDPRIDHAVGRRGIDYLGWGKHPGTTWIRDQTYAGPYSPKKFVFTKSELDNGGVDKSSWTPGYTAINYPLMRYADVLLMAAECEVEAGSVDKAKEYVNKIRARAANPEGFVKNGNSAAAKYVINQYTNAWDKAYATKAIQMERRLELSDEGHRFYDLVRWGVADSELNRYLTFEGTQASSSPFKGVKFTKGKSELLPIPQREIDVLGSATLKQNPGY